MFATLPLRASEVAAPRFRSALRQLSKHGGQALRPTLVTRDGDEKSFWLSPTISKRKAAVLRKQAISAGTYGSFDADVGGWDPAWDIQAAIAQTGSQGRPNRQRVPKKTSRQRTRESRAVKIEKELIGMDDRIEQHHVQRHAKKPSKSFENTYKNLMKVK